MRKCRAAPIDEFDGDRSASAKRARTEEGSDDDVDAPKLRLRRVPVGRMGLGMGNSI